MESIWDNPVCINDGVFITSENGKFKMFQLEQGSFILPTCGENFTEQVIEFIKTHYDGYKFAKDKNKYLVDKVDRSDFKYVAKNLI